MNRVIAGDYAGLAVSAMFGAPYIMATPPVYLDRGTVASHELMDESHKKSTGNVIGRGIVGGLLFGPVGALGGALTAGTKGAYVIRIQFKNGKKSLIEVDQKLYKTIMKAMF